MSIHVFPTAPSPTHTHLTPSIVFSSFFRRERSFRSDKAFNLGCESKPSHRGTEEEALPRICRGKAGKATRKILHLCEVLLHPLGEVAIIVVNIIRR